MATISPTTEFLDPSRKVVKFVWAGLANGDSGGAIEFSTYSRRSAQVHGTFGVGGSVLIEGSNNGEASYATLNDAAVAALTFGAAAIKSIVDIAERVRPRVTAGDGTTSLTVTLLCTTA